MKTKRKKTSGLSSSRYGAAAVEAALMLPLLIIVSFGSIDVAQYINLAQLVANASREGARIASRDGTKTVSEVESAIVAYMADTLPAMPENSLKEALRIKVNQARSGEEISGGKLTTIESGDPISIQVQFDFATVRWLRGPDYWNNNVQVSTTVCRRE